MNQVTLDGAKLKAIAHKSKTAEVTALSLAMRERLRHSSDITRTRSELARAGERIVESDYMQFWKDLQAAGVGSIIYGRKGKPDRFDWHYSLKAVSKACIEGTDVSASKLAMHEEPVKVKSILRKANKAKGRMTADEKDMKSSQAGNVETVEGNRLVYIPLRKNFHVEISVPADFSKDEADVLAKALSRAAI